ncbi:type II toxin-antitoxin system RelE/ParE family toxin [Candidatus Peregrinibacteria bacterium]|nr:type II toxin-antitoxin system RelE/ParE family toxin [Candidatus Peregrinibacteria bacterium]
MPDKITKFVNALDAKTRKRLKERLKSLRENPLARSQDVKKLKGWGKNTYRLRMGDIRIIYRLNDSKVAIIDIDFRGNVY